MKGYIILDGEKQRRCKKCRKYYILEHFKWPYTKTCIQCVHNKLSKNK